VSEEKLKIILASPRSFCAGVVRAIDIVEKALEIYGPPIYSKHEIVHNSYVIKSLEKKGVIFTENLDEVPEKSVLVFSAHGVSPEVKQKAKSRDFEVIDATCPLVSKVHKEARRYALNDYTIFLIGHKEHVEVIGTFGYAPKQTIIINTLEDVEKLKVPPHKKLAYITQTTLSLDDTAEIVAALKEKYPRLEAPSKEDICYATQNRQNAVKQMCTSINMLIVIGSSISSNTIRLVEIAKKKNIPAYRIEAETELKAEWFQKIQSVGITAGASAPEIIVQNIVKKIQSFRKTTIENFNLVEENTFFVLPPHLEKAHQKKLKGTLGK
jgi:4-hydroxy-3-methylbut-2-enyl diphosphate reductase